MSCPRPLPDVLRPELSESSATSNGVEHYANIGRFIDGLGLKVELLTGSIKGKRREAILKGLKDGSVNILVSTHAVLEDPVEFNRLGFVVIDEQHRFGVAQRARLWTKSNMPPHVLVMTATPIPRTLAMTLYGDLDVSVIDELPPGRKPIHTEHYYDGNHTAVYAFLDRELKKGRQAYIVYPLIEESEKIDLKNLEEGYLTVCERFAGYKVSKVHGRMKPAEKDAEMQRFKNNETQIMVATTVIEVGVDVPNASVMLIENANRFGLSQLHQLRGRVGRGADQSYCMLITPYQLSEDTRKRTYKSIVQISTFIFYRKRGHKSRIEALTSREILDIIRRTIRFWRCLS